MSSGRPPASKFRRLALTHATMMAGEASMVVALADSFFFDVDPTAARSRVLLFLLVSFTPFLIVAPLIGPVIDRVRGGRRFVVQLAAITRIVLQLLMMRYADQLALFPLVFFALVVQKTYAVSKSALVPSVVRNERELVEANSKLGLIAGVTGFVAVIPAGLLQLTLGTTATLGYGALVFVVALVSATRLPRDSGAVQEAGAGPARALPMGLVLAARSMFVLRCCVGFLMFHLAFWFRTQDAGTVWFAFAVGLSSLGTMAGNVTGPRVRRVVAEERMLAAALVLPLVVGVAAAVLGGNAAAIALAVTVNFAAAVGRLAFESMVQRDAPSANRGRTFARFETRFQLGWVVAAMVPVIIVIPGPVGLLIVSAFAGAALVIAGGRARSVGLSGRRPAVSRR